MEIKTQRLLIRDFIKEDLEAVHKYASQEDILIYEPWGPNTEEQTRKFITRSINEANESPRTFFELAITLKNDGQLIGGCSIRINSKNRKLINIGYIVNPAFWNRGIATETVVALIKFALENLGTEKIQASADEYNIASQRVLEKSGLTKINALHRDLKFKGRTSRTFIYSLTFTTK